MEGKTMVNNLFTESQVLFNENDNSTESEVADIFFVAYKEFINLWNIKDDTYKIVSDDDFENHSNLQHFYYPEYDDKRMQELTHIYYELGKYYQVWKLYPIKKYIGFLHGRQRFDYQLQTKFLDNIFSEYDIIMPSKVNCGMSVYQQYAKHQNQEDLDRMLNILHDTYPEYDDSAIEVMSQNMFYRCNTFIMKKEDFNKWCEFVFPLLSKYLDVLEKDYNLKTEEDIKNWVKDNIDKYGNSRIDYPSHFNTVGYLSAFLGHLTERLTNIFVNFHFDKDKIYEIPLLEYNTRE